MLAAEGLLKTRPADLIESTAAKLPSRENSACLPRLQVLPAVESTSYVLPTAAPSLSRSHSFSQQRLMEKDPVTAFFLCDHPSSQLLRPASQLQESIFFCRDSQASMIFYQSMSLLPCSRKDLALLWWLSCWPRACNRSSLPSNTTSKQKSPRGYREYQVQLDIRVSECCHGCLIFSSGQCLHLQP